MFDHTRLGEFIEQIRLTPAIWRNREFGIGKSHMDEIWAHLGHTFDVPAEETEKQWLYLVRLHRFMNKNAPEKAFRIHVSASEDVWTMADSLVADSLSLFYKESLDELLLVSEPTESSV